MTIMIKNLNNSHTKLLTDKTICPLGPWIIAKIKIHKLIINIIVITNKIRYYNL